MERQADQGNEGPGRLAGSQLRQAAEQLRERAGHAATHAQAVQVCSLSCSLFVGAERAHGLVRAG